MTDLNKMVDELSKLSVMEAAELSKLLQEKWGVSAAAPVAVAAVAGGGAEEQKSAEKDTFDIYTGSSGTHIESADFLQECELICNLFDL